MKLHLQVSSSNAVTAYDDDYVEVNRVRHLGPVWFTADGPASPWAAGSPQTLAAQQLESCLAVQADILLIGTGARQIFPPRELLRALLLRGIGVEIMDTPAACRTFNILVPEGRQVVAALFLPGIDFSA